MFGAFDTFFADTALLDKKNLAAVNLHNHQILQNVVGASCLSRQRALRAAHNSGEPMRDDE